MKLTIVLFVLLSLQVTAQDWEPTQTDSIYMVNHVKSRVLRFGNQEGSRIVNSYDYNGRIIEREQFDTKGKQLYNKSLFAYDKDGKLFSNEYFTYWHNDSKGMIVQDTLPNKASITTSSFAYDLLGRLVSSTIKNVSGATIYEGHYVYDAFTTLVSKWHSPSMEGHYTSSTIVYEAPGL